MKERLIAYLKEKNFTVHAFEKHMGWPVSTISQFKKGLRSDKLIELCNEFPDLDIRWLLTGEPTKVVVEKDAEMVKLVESIENSMVLQKKLYDNLWTDYQRLKGEYKELRESMA